MPIRRELRSLYPAHWSELSRRVRFERAGGRCQGCGRPHGSVVRCLPDGRWLDPAQTTWRDGRGRIARWPDLEHIARLRTTRVVLAAAHLDHDPTNNRLRNLRSLPALPHAPRPPAPSGPAADHLSAPPRLGRPVPRAVRKVGQPQQHVMRVKRGQDRRQHPWRGSSPVIQAADRRSGSTCASGCGSTPVRRSTRCWR